MGKLTNHTGSIPKRNDGRYQGVLQVYGVRRTVYGKTRSEVVRDGVLVCLYSVCA
jgi:hypothetical protein